MHTVIIEVDNNASSRVYVYGLGLVYYNASSYDTYTGWIWCTITELHVHLMVIVVSPVLLTCSVVLLSC